MASSKAVWFALALAGCKVLEPSEEADQQGHDIISVPPAPEGATSADPPGPPPPAVPTNPVGGTCVADCNHRVCGLDPACAMSCGTCPSDQACNATQSTATCGKPTITWELDGKPIVALGSTEAFYITRDDKIGLWFPYWGRNVTITVPTPSKQTIGLAFNCPSDGKPPPPQWAPITFSTLDNGHAELDAVLPDKWKNLTLGPCGLQPSGDTTYSYVVLTTIDKTHVVGSWQVLVIGGGPRTGSTLRVHGEFDVKPVSDT